MVKIIKKATSSPYLGRATSATERIGVIRLVLFFSFCVCSDRFSSPVAALRKIPFFFFWYSVTVTMALVTKERGQIFCESIKGLHVRKRDQKRNMAVFFCHLRPK